MTEKFVTDTDYRVYSAFLDTFEFYRNVPSKEAIIIFDSTTINPRDINRQTPWAWVRGNSGNRCRYYNDEVRCRKAQDPVWTPLFDALKQPVNQRSVALQPRFTTRYPTKVLSGLQLQKLHRDDGQLPVYYVFGLSAIVYNADQTKALFFSSFFCGGKCGRGELVMLEKTNQTWALIDTFRFWIA